MTTVIELIEWLNRFHGTDQVAIVDAEDLNLGPSLRILGTPYYYEVGGMPEIGDEKPTKLQSLLIDVRYAIEKWHRPDARALDGLERVRETLETECKRIKPKTHAAQLDKPA